MSFFSFKGLVDSISSILSSDPPPAAMAEEAGPSVVNERVALKLKGYFDLAKEEIDKAVRAEEWGLPDDAVTTTPMPTASSSRPSPPASQTPSPQAASTTK
ncbi:uncharacterized protein M6B38_375020 [Iris pallida]|uniref:Uncharacterized protein n=1 Tax=Iris pallida TaxID=29817 RepID=A0AAX6GBE5_IRIPA|nr:uncharacterized protein M6B38_375020 [Iris pallida]